MRLDVLTIFPDYLRPLDLSLIGKARREGLLDLRVHDVRDFTRDRHRTVDDTPYGGGAGMVMTPEPWALALESLREGPGDGAPTLIVPGPAGRLFTQELARELATQPWLAFACGRYEGIDERVYEFAAQDLGLRVEVVSLGDYVLNGGEVAALAMIEAIARLVPGVVGNPESLVEESHSDGLLEYPVYTKPASWRGRAVPEVLLSGDHARIAGWRTQAGRERTRARRPELIAAAEVAQIEDIALRVATPADTPELLVLQRCCWVEEAGGGDPRATRLLQESLEDVRRDLSRWTTWVARDASGRLVGAVRGRVRETCWEVERLMVAPDVRGRGLGRRLLAHAEEGAPAGTSAIVLIAGAGGRESRRGLRRLGYRPSPPERRLLARSEEAAELVGTIEFVKRPAGIS